MKQKAESENHRLTLEMQKLNEICQERAMKITELQEKLIVCERDLTNALKEVEVDGDAKANFLKQIRDFQNKLQDLQSDMESERQSRRRLEKEKAQLLNEMKTLHEELLHHQDDDEVRTRFERTRDEEVNKLNRQMEQLQKDHEAFLIDNRKKNNKRIEEITNEMETTQRQLQILVKEHQKVQVDFEKLINENRILVQQKQELERKRRQLEVNNQELEQKLDTIEREKEESVERTSRLQQENELNQNSCLEFEQRCQAQERIIGKLKNEIGELETRIQEESRSKSLANSRGRQVEDSINQLNDLLREREEEIRRFELKQSKLMEQHREQLKTLEATHLDQLDEVKRKFQHEKEELNRQIEEEKAINSKLIKANQKSTNDINDLTIELDRHRSIGQSSTKQQRIFEKKLQDEKILQENLRQERDQIEREYREKETQRLNLLKEHEELQTIHQELERRWRRIQTDEPPVSVNDLAARIREFEKLKYRLGQLTNFCRLEKGEKKTKNFSFLFSHFQKRSLKNRINKSLKFKINCKQRTMRVFEQKSMLEF